MTGLLITGVLAVGLGCYFLGHFTKSKPPVALPPKYPDLLRMAIRMHYVAHEGTLSKSGSVVRFDADGPESADEFIETVLALVELAN